MTKKGKSIWLPFFVISLTVFMYSYDYQQKYEY